MIGTYLSVSQNYNKITELYIIRIEFQLNCHARSKNVKKEIILITRHFNLNTCWVYSCKQNCGSIIATGISQCSRIYVSWIILILPFILKSLQPSVYGAMQVLPGAHTCMGLICSHFFYE